MTSHTEYVRGVAQMARDLSDHVCDGRDELWALVAAGAVQHISGATCAAATAVVDHQLVGAGATDSTAAQVWQIQAATMSGPSVEAATSQTDGLVCVEDYGRETRWPKVAAAVVATTPVRSTLAVQMFCGGSIVGSLTVHGSQPGVFDEDAVEVGMAVATHAAVAIHHAHREGQFAAALASRDAIGQAKGIIMNQFGIDATRAWELLRTLSQDSNTPVSVLAQQVIATN